MSERDPGAGHPDALELSAPAARDQTIRQAQDQLAHVLGDARASEDRELARTVRELGEQLARILHGLLRLSQLHDPSNHAFDGPVTELSRTLAALVDTLGPAHLTCVENAVYVNDLRLRFDTDQQHAVFLASSLRAHNAGGVTFSLPMAEAQVRTLVKLLVAEPAPLRPRTTLQERLSEAGLAGVELQPVYRFQTEGEELDRDFADVCCTAARQLAEVFANVRARRLPNPLPIRRVVHDLVDIGRHADGAALAYRADRLVPPFAGHTLTVTNHALMIGRAAGLSEVTLADLGMAAMYHDIGIFAQAEDQGAPFRQHLSAALAVLIRERGFHPARVRRLLTLLEHHRDFRHPVRPSLFARIVHIADDFDILTRDRPETGPLVAHPYALRMLAAQGGVLYDPILLQVFVNAVGTFPPGSILCLTDDRCVVSISGARSPQTFARPLCRVLRLAARRPPAAAATRRRPRGGAPAPLLRSPTRPPPGALV